MLTISLKIESDYFEGQFIMAMAVIYGNFGGRIVSVTTNGETKDVVRDTLGSVAALIDETGTVTDTIEYWPYGEIRTKTGSTAIGIDFIGTLGYFRDALSRLYVRARILKPEYGQWLTQDSIWPWQLPFAYVDDTPVTTVDPSGLLGFGRYCGPNRNGPGNPINNVDACCQVHDRCLATICDWFNPVKKMLCDCNLANCILGNIKSSCGWNFLCWCGAFEVYKWASQECGRLGNPLPSLTPPNPGWICFALG